MPDEHVITDEETRRIAEAYLTSSPWLGSAVWGQIVIGPNAEYLADFDGTFDAETKLGDDQRWSWTVTFSDPSGQEQRLNHETVLEGLRGLVYGEVPAGPEGVSRWEIRKWFTKPAEERRAAGLNSSNSSRVCQQALYGRKVFDTEDDIQLRNALRSLGEK